MHAVNFFLILCYHCLNAGTEAPMRWDTKLGKLVVEHETSAIGSKRVLRVPSLVDPTFDIPVPPIPFRIEWKTRDFFTWRLGGYLSSAQLTEAQSNKGYLCSGLPTPRDTERAPSFTLLSGSLGNCLQDQDKQSMLNLTEGIIPRVRPQRQDPNLPTPASACSPPSTSRTLTTGPVGTHLLHARADPSMIGVSISVWSRRAGGSHTLACRTIQNAYRARGKFCASLGLAQQLATTRGQLLACEADEA
ncbi:hypothetical protein B0H11DRAFT_2230454 [Mycena galericulata]|nr:hypothetical protein B0H11DRAFT_2230454 [Mycena galericulata]